MLVVLTAHMLADLEEADPEIAALMGFGSFTKKK